MTSASYRCMIISDETVSALYLSSLPSKISSTSTARSNVMFDASECWPNPTAHANNAICPRAIEQYTTVAQCVCGHQKYIVL